ncbi:MAG: hypothetical protein COA42_01285 [Alteromonadaceae bacterium]|nr:MAG: hypothetical protein COA42_01285 [Alteromonadaceae bacterium]
MGLFDKNKLEKLLADTQVSVKPRVMIVDDEPGNLTALRSLLERYYEVIEARDGREAIDIVLDMEDPQSIALVLSDQRMPRMAGTDLFQRLTALLPDAVRILLTGYSDIDSIRDSINKAKIYKFMGKPYDPDELLLVVKRGVENYESCRNTNNYQAELEDKVKRRAQELEQKKLELEDKNEKLKQAYEKLDEARMTDSLTGLHNRRYLQNIVASDIVLCDREYDKWLRGRSSELPGYHDISFFLLDIDSFKAVNDRYGRLVGDQLLVEIGKVLRAVIRETDYLVRWGGGEFLIVTRFSSRSYATDFAGRLRAAIADHRFFVGDGAEISKTCSIGYASYPFIRQNPNSVGWESIIGLADIALLTAKKGGADAWVGVLANDSCLAVEVSDALEANSISALIAEEKIQGVASFDTMKLAW